MTIQEFEQWVREKQTEFFELQWEHGDKTWDGFAHESYQKPIKDFLSLALHEVRTHTFKEAEEAVPKEKMYDEKSPDTGTQFMKRFGMGYNLVS